MRFVEEEDVFQRKTQSIEDAELRWSEPNEKDVADADDLHGASLRQRQVGKRLDQRQAVDVNSVVDHDGEASFARIFGRDDADGGFVFMIGGSIFEPFIQNQDYRLIYFYRVYTFRGYLRKYEYISRSIRYFQTIFLANKHKEQKQNKNNNKKQKQNQLSLNPPMKKNPT